MDILDTPVSLNLIVYTIITFTFIICQVEPSGLINSDWDLKRPISFKELEGTNFRIYKRRFSWEAAFVFCSRCVGNFATFSSPEELDKVRDAIYGFSHFSEAYDQQLKRDEFGLDRRYWIGLHDQKNHEGTWKWVKNTRDHPTEMMNEGYPWYTNQPDHKEVGSSNDMEHCVGFWNPVYHLDSTPKRLEKHTLNDMPCNHKYYFICDKVDPPPYSGEEPQFCKVPIPEKFGHFFGKDSIPMLSVEKASNFLEKEAHFEHVKDGSAPPPPRAPIPITPQPDSIEIDPPVSPPPPRAPIPITPQPDSIEIDPPLSPPPPRAPIPITPQPDSIEIDPPLSPPPPRAPIPITPQPDSIEVTPPPVSPVGLGRSIKKRLNHKKRPSKPEKHKPNVPISISQLRKVRLASLI